MRATPTAANDTPAPHDAFEQARPGLLGLAYRLLGSHADAEDAVQDTYLKWQACAQAEIRSPAAWLSTACTRRCLDLLRNAHRARVSYVGTWLPEPLQVADEPDPAAEAELASSLGTAFLLLLDRLTPKERAAYLLHEIFDLDHAAVAGTLGVGEAASRQLVTRARRHVDRARVRTTTPAEQQARLLAAFETAIRHGRTAPLASLLADDVRLAADGGGKAAAVRRVFEGPAEVLDVVARGLHVWLRESTMERAIINGRLGLLVRDPSSDALESVVSFDYDDRHALRGIYIMRNPDKLQRVDAAPVRIR